MLSSWPQICGFARATSIRTAKPRVVRKSKNRMRKRGSAGVRKRLNSGAVRMPHQCKLPRSHLACPRGLPRIKCRPLQLRNVRSTMSTSRFQRSQGVSEPMTCLQVSLNDGGICSKCSAVASRLSVPVRDSNRSWRTGPFHENACYPRLLFPTILYMVNGFNRMTAMQ
jgi:hypothetical protein